MKPTGIYVVHFFQIMLCLRGFMFGNVKRFSNFVRCVSSQFVSFVLVQNCVLPAVNTPISLTSVTYVNFETILKTQEEKI